MTDTEQTTRGVRLALLDAELQSGKINRTEFVSRVAELGSADGLSRANGIAAIAANQAARQATLRNSYDYVIIGSGASGAVVAGRLAADKNAHVLVLEAGGSDLPKAGSLPLRRLERSPCGL